MKHIVLVFMAFLLATVAGCGRKSDTTGRDSAVPDGKAAGMIGVSLLTLDNPFFKVIGDTITEEARKNGYETVVVSGDKDVARQSNQIKDFIVKKVSAIVLSPCDSKSIVPVIQEANAAGIPVFTVDIPCYEPGVKIVTQVASDNFSGGQQAGRAMIEALGEAGGKIAILAFKQAESCLLRVKGFREVIDAHNASGEAAVNIVAELERSGAKDLGYKAAEDTLQAHPDLRGIFAINDPAALGARAALEKAGRTQISAEDAFRLHDTSGFPIDLTQVMADEALLSVDVVGYEALMEAARDRSRGGGSAAEGMHFPPDAIAKLEDLQVKPTDDHGKFAGKPINATLMAIWNGKSFDDHVEADSSRTLAFVFGATPMYAEMGGQVADHGSFRVDRASGHGGEIERSSGGTATVEINDVQRAGAYVLHIGRVTHGRIACGETGQLMLARERRDSIRANHSATHAMNHALRAVAGDEVEQKGSLVDGEKLRFDYAAKSALTVTQIEEVQRRVNASIHATHVVDAREIPLAVARGINGVRAVFGERYPDPVRVVAIGATVAELVANPTNSRWSELSIEFCGGTHLAAMGDAKQFVLVSEGGLAAGVRRVFALTGPRALAANFAAETLAARIHATEKINGEALFTELSDITKLLESLELGAVARVELDKALEPVRERAKNARKQAEGATRDIAVAQARTLVEVHAQSSTPTNALIAMINGADAAALLAAIDAARAKLGNTPVLFLSPDFEAGKVAIAATSPQSAIDKGLKAGDWVKATAQACGGAGGGKPDTAQAGGKDPSKTREALDAAKAFITAKGL